MNGNGSAGQGARMLAVPRAVALAVIAVLVAAASAAAFAESYRGLFDWAAGHGLAGAWAVIWPVQVDVFIAVGELALFVALVDRWAPRSRWAAWAVTGAGLAVSVAGNVGHVASHALADRVTAAVPPVAAAAALAVALGILKRVVEGHERGRDGGTAVGARPGAVPAASLPASLPKMREIQDRQQCSPTTAKKIRAELKRYAKDSPADRLAAGGSGPGVGSPPGARAAHNGGPHG